MSNTADQCIVADDLRVLVPMPDHLARLTTDLYFFGRLKPGVQPWPGLGRILWWKRGRLLLCSSRNLILFIAEAWKR